ncbi:hypothetical protein QAD02_019441 [Eretmocerus hayati]|uniref:Uncharacterized protein n=1 Tax=Eretmocerus hayati TaxID=131215 RepID=A0ACC2PJ96_9HYME|nr:hypothetical protein QAD02_019441 [Eretmocerus hayati]
MVDEDRRERCSYGVLSRVFSLSTKLNHLPRQNDSRSFLQIDQMNFHDAIAKILEEEDLDVNYSLPINACIARHSPNLIGNTILHFAHYNSTYSFLSQEKSSKNCYNSINFISQNINGSSPIHLTIERIVAKSGREIEAKVQLGKNSRSDAVYLAAQCDEGVLKYLLTNEVMNEGILLVPDAYGVSPLDICIMRHGFEVFKFLSISLKEILNIQNTEIWNLLLTLGNGAILEKNLNTIETNIAEWRVSYNSVIWQGFTLLHIAVILAKKGRIHLEHIDTSELDLFYHDRKLSDNDITITHISTLMRHGADFTVQDAYGRLPLHLAFRLGKYNVVKSMLKQGTFYLNPVDETGLSHFHIACLVGDLDAVKAYLINGIPPNDPIHCDHKSLTEKDFEYVVCKKGSTSLHIAVYQKRKEMIEILLSNGADVFAQAKDGCTPIHLVFSFCKDTFDESIQDIVNTILQAFNMQNMISSPVRPDSSHTKTLKSTTRHMVSHYAIKDHCIVEALMMRNRVEYHSVYVEERKTALMKAALRMMDQEENEGRSRYRALSRVYSAVDCKGEVRLRDTIFTPGVDPVGKCDAIAKILEEENLDMDYSVPSNSLAGRHSQHLIGNTGLHFALQQQKSDSRDAHLDDTPDHALYKLHLACISDERNELQDISKEMFNVQHGQTLGYTAVHFAAQFDEESLKYLLMNGGNLLMSDTHGTTPFDIFIVKHEEGILSLLLEPLKELIHFEDARAWDVLPLLCNSDELERYLSKLDEDLTQWRVTTGDSEIWRGYTLLHIAVILTNEGLMNLEHSDCNEYDLIDSKCGYYRDQDSPCVPNIEILMRHGADFTAQDAHGRSPLHLAFRLGKYSIVKLILKHSTSLLNPVDESGLSHFHIACLAGDLNAVREYLFNGTPVNDPINCDHKCLTEKDYEYVVCRKGSTPLHIAVHQKRKEMIEILLSNGADVFAPDEDGLTPIHLVLSFCEDSFDGRIQELVTCILTAANIPTKNLVSIDSSLSSIPYWAVSNHCIAKSLMKHQVECGQSESLGTQVESCQLIDGSNYGKCEIHTDVTGCLHLVLMLISHDYDGICPLLSQLVTNWSETALPTEFGLGKIHIAAGYVFIPYLPYTNFIHFP